jgi:hypothetical protein
MNGSFRMKRTAGTNGARNRSVRRDITLCTSVALFIATAFSGWVLAVHFFRGDGPFERLGTSLGATVLLYFSAALVVGPVVGLLLPVARAGRAGAALTGTVAAVPLYAMGLVTLEGVRPLTLRDAVIVLLLAGLVGAPVGVVYRRMFGG